MSAEPNQWAGLAIDGSAATLNSGGGHRFTTELQLAPNAQRVYCTASRPVSHGLAPSAQFESSAEHGLVVLSAVDNDLMGVQKMVLQEQARGLETLTVPDDEGSMEEELMAADLPVQALHVDLVSSRLSAGAEVCIELADYEVDLLCAFACAPQGWLSVQAIDGVFAWRGRRVQRHILELRLWRLRRKIKALGLLEVGLHFVCEKGYQMRLPICVDGEFESNHQSLRADRQTSGDLAGTLLLHEQAMRLQYADRWVDIQAHEMVLLAAMSRAVWHRLTYAEVFDIYGWPDDLPHRKAAEVRLVRLRKKIAELGVALPAIKAVRKVGYQLCFAIQLVEANGA